MDYERRRQCRREVPGALKVPGGAGAGDTVRDLPVVGTPGTVFKLLPEKLLTLLLPMQRLKEAGTGISHPPVPPWGSSP